MYKCNLCGGSYTLPMKSFILFCDSVLDIKVFVHPLQNSVPINTNKLKVRNESKRNLQLSEGILIYFLRLKRTADLANWSATIHQ